MSRLSCNKCDHNCTSFNDGKTFAVHDKDGFIWLDSGKYAPCGVILTDKNGDRKAKKPDDNFCPENWA